MAPAQHGDLLGRAVAPLDPDHFRRSAEQETSLMEVCVLRHDRQTVTGGILPDRVVICGLEAFVLYVGRAAVEISEDGQQPGRENWSNSSLTRAGS